MVGWRSRAATTSSAPAGAARLPKSTPARPGRTPPNLGASRMDILSELERAGGLLSQAREVARRSPAHAQALISDAQVILKGVTSHEAGRQREEIVAANVSRWRARSARPGDHERSCDCDVCLDRAVMP